MTHMASMNSHLLKSRQHLWKGRSANLVGFGDDRYLVLNTSAPSLRWSWDLNLWEPLPWQPMKLRTLLWQWKRRSALFFFKKKKKKLVRTFLWEMGLVFIPAGEDVDVTITGEAASAERHLVSVSKACTRFRVAAPNGKMLSATTP